MKNTIMKRDILLPITPRHREIWRSVANGNPDKKTAELMGVCLDTVVRHRCDLMRRLREHGFNVHNTADLTRAAIGNRIITVPVLPVEETI